MNGNSEEIMLDLLCKKAVYGLTEQEEKQLTELQRAADKADQSESFERAVAAIHLANVDPSEELPAALRNRILAEAEQHFGTARFDAPAEKPATAGWFGWLGWAFAAVASIALAVNLYYTSSTRVGVVRNPTGPTPTPTESLTPQQMRQRLIETAPDLARGSWAAGNMKDMTPTGDIVWSDTKQAGYMRLTGLPVNDPAKEVYQLWIFDETQDPKTPIDGGTFSVSSTGEVIIPINAKLPPRNTSMYAITVEKSPGVTVSKREKLVALAKRET